MGRERWNWKKKCVEELFRRKKNYGGCLKPTTFEVPKPSTKSKPVVNI